VGAGTQPIDGPPIRSSHITASNPGRISAILLALILSGEAMGAQTPPAEPSCARAAFDHVPIAVRSLDDAERTYRALGFRLKPGRPHANGLRNAFAKLPDGSYLELISPERGGVDEITRRYVEQLGSGEGGAMLALRADSLAGVSRRLAEAGLVTRSATYGRAFSTLALLDEPVRWLFLIEYLTPVVDPPELLAHPNGAVGLETVWLRADAFAAYAAVGGVLCRLAIREVGEPAASGPVAGVTLTVRSVDRAVAVLSAGGLELRIRSDHRGRSVAVPPASAHGVFIELLEPHLDPHGAKP
jgi:catechol 2,3-dioxygenase-like lactoylglutathione lyase family enzyme